MSYARVSNEVAAQWMSRARVLHDNVVDARGQRTYTAAAGYMKLHRDKKAWPANTRNKAVA